MSRLKKATYIVVLISGCLVLLFIVFYLFTIFSTWYTLRQQGKLENIKQFELEFIDQDSGLKAQAKESGLGEKMKRAPTKDSFNYYHQQFSIYNDSVVRHRDSLKRFEDSLYGVK